jgi:hypothetical protein
MQGSSFWKQCHVGQHLERTATLPLGLVTAVGAAAGAAVGAVGTAAASTTLVPLAAVKSTRAFGARLVLTVVSSGCPFFVTVASSWRRPLKLRPLACMTAQQSLIGGCAAKRISQHSMRCAAFLTRLLNL